jgi:exo-beta-1,3-glucanase (GH17 family)/cellulose synthase/poly-beta-1,6-N-acetylglucosamine synthase-like glycosyltransferase
MRSVAVVVALVACVHAAAWALVRGQATAPDFGGQLASVSYAPYSNSAHPDTGDSATEEQIRADLKVIAPYTRALRTYSSTGGVELVPQVAAEFGLKVTVGAWIDKDAKRNEREMNSVIALARRHSNVNGIVVGNETIFRADQTVDDLIEMIKRVKRSSQVPVTTGEIWSTWIQNPKLAYSVDFIAAHILPYWNKIPDKQAVDEAIERYNQLRRAYPGKRIVIAEFGWPSAGYNRYQSDPGRIEQAEVLRTFVSRAEAYGIDYNIVEAIDQPWKVFEGSVGPYWGIFDASRAPKFAWTGPITDSDHWKLAGLSVLIGLLMSLPILVLSRATIPQAVLLGVSANVVGAWIATIFAYWKGHYFVPGAAFALGLGLTLLVPLVAIALARMQEIAAVAFGQQPLRLVASPPMAAELPSPKVSIHIPAYREPPEMLKQTLDAVARLDYPNLECVVVINNTPDAAFWRPIEEHCRVLGERFKFVNAESLQGFKAGALRLALIHTASDAEIIGVIDADYVVRPEWLKDLVPLFADAKVGLVQAPQDHRDADRSVMHDAMNCEYAGFFDIGMVQRNEVNAIITHGTMCLIRRTALEAAGSWSSDTICEDADLGLTILELGWVAHYTNRRYGHGLLPDTFEAFKKQRNRWAYGGLQIVKKHWRRFLPGESKLSREQKREYSLGWLNWLGAESIGVVVAILNLLWVPIVAFAGIAVPDKILTIPIAAAFAVSLMHFFALYPRRVQIARGKMMRAVFAAMSVQWTVAHAVGQGLIKDHLPFVRTAKGGHAHKGREFQAFWEAVLATLLLIGAVTLVVTNETQVREIYIFAAVLVIQSIPFLSAVAVAALEGSRFNEFAFWRSLEARLMLLVPRRPSLAKAAVLAKAVADAPAQLPADKRVDAPLVD